VKARNISNKIFQNILCRVCLAALVSCFSRNNTRCVYLCFLLHKNKIQEYQFYAVCRINALIIQCMESMIFDKFDQFCTRGQRL